MTEIFQVVAYDQDGIPEVLGYFNNLDKAEEFCFKCAEGDDKHDPCEYIIESTSIAD